MSAPVTERGSSVSVLTAAGLGLCLAAALVVLVLIVQGQGPSLLAAVKGSAVDAAAAVAEAWRAVESFLSRVMYR